MENNNMNDQQANWQQALNQFDDQPQQAQAQPQQAQAQYTQPQQAQAQPQQAQFAQPEAPSYSSNDFAATQPITKKNKILPIVLIIVAVAIVVGGVIFACFTFFGNKGGSYEGAERNYFANAKNTVSEVIGNLNKTGEQTTITLSFPAELTGGQDYGSIILSTKSFVDTDANKLSSSIGIKSDKRDYLTANFWCEGKTFYAQIPELSETCLKMDMEKFSESIMNMSGSSSLDYSDIESGLIDGIETAVTDNAMALVDISSGSSVASVYGNMDKLKELFTSENLDSLVSIAATAYFNNFKAEDFANSTMETAEKTINCNVYKIKFSMKNVGNFIVEFFDELKKNDSLYSSIQDATGLSGDSLEQFVSMVESQLKETDEEELESSMGEMVVYTLNGNIIGRDIKFGTDESNQVSLNITSVDNGEIFEYSVALKSESTNIYIGASGKVNGDKYEGSGKLVTDDTTYATVEFTTDKKTGNGEFNIKLINDDESTIELDITIDGDENKKTVDITGKKDGSAVVNINGVTEKIAFEEISIPSGDNVLDVSDMSTAEDTLQKYAEEASAGLQKIYESTSAGDDLLSMIFQILAMRGSMSY